MKKLLSENQITSSENETGNDCADQSDQFIVDLDWDSYEVSVFKKNKKQRLLIPICLEQGIVLFTPDPCRGERFASLFADVWASIPYGERKFMKNHWDIEDDYDPEPMIELIDLIVEGVVMSPKDIRCGFTDIYFDIALVDELSDLELKTLIAYQLERMMFSAIISECHSRSYTRKFSFFSFISDFMGDWGYNRDGVSPEMKSRLIIY